MNANQIVYTSSHLALSTRRAVAMLLVATLIALSAVVAQHSFSAWSGIGSASVAQACQGSGGAGSC